MIGSSNCTIIQTQTSKTTQKWVTEHKTKLLLWREEAQTWSCESKGSGVILDEGMVSDLVSGVLWPEPCRRWVSELKRRSCESEDLEWFWMKEWSLISCQVFSDLNPVEDEWVNWRGEAVNLKIWSDSGWRNGLWSRVRCSLTSSGIIGENVELLNWQMEVSKSIK